MLKVEHLQMRIGNFMLTDICMELPAGFMCGLIGENGAGKTTLLKCIMGMYHADSGHCFINDYDMEKQEEQAKGCIGFMLDEDIFSMELTPGKIGKQYGCFYKNYDESRYEQYLTEFCIPKEQKMKKLSKGMRKKVQFAFALSHEAGLYVFDEPTAGLDKPFRKQFYEICGEIIAKGKSSILISSHITEDLEERADYLFYIKNGKRVFYETQMTLKESFSLVNAENYKLRLLPKEKVVYMEEGTYGGSALVCNSGRISLKEGYDMAEPTIQQMMYYMSKGKWLGESGGKPEGGYRKGERNYEQDV